MKKLLILLAVMIVWTSSVASTSAFDPAAVLAAPTKVGTHGLVSSQFIYPLEGRQTPECHASTIVSTPTGLVAAWFGGKHEKNPDVGIWVSRFEDDQWTRPSEVVNGVQSGQLRHPCWNPVLFQPTTGPLLLFYKVGPTPRTWWGMLVTSNDGGKSWNKPTKLGKDSAIGHIVGPVKNKPIELSDGSILCPSSSEHNNWRVHFELTKDQGKTWEIIGPIHDGKKFNAIQPSILTYKNGSMQVMCRTQEGVIAESWSTDSGQTWSQPAATHLPNPNSGTDAITLADGRQLLVYNHTVNGGEFPVGRNMLNVAISDDGKTWQPVLTLERDQGEYSYPAVIQAANGTIHIAYTWQRQTVKHVTINPQKL